MICYVNLRTRCWVYNTYLSHQNMCFVLILKYPHTWTLKIHSIHPGPHWNMKMGDIAVSGRNILATDQMLWTAIKENFLITDQKYSLITVRTNTMLLIEENLGLATGFSEVGAALARSPNLEAIEDILKEKGCQRSSHQGRCQNVIISILESCDSIPILSRIKPPMTQSEGIP